MNEKQLVARRALDFIENGMLLGLGSGSTMKFFVDLLGESLQSGRLAGIRAVPTSEATARQARELNIPLITLVDGWQVRQPPVLDLAVDGADEVDPNLNLIKGLGRALLREKVIVVNSRDFLVLVDQSKLVPRLGTRGPLPVEILPFEAQSHVLWLNSLGCRAELWLEPDGSPVVTDNGNYLVRCWFDGGIADPAALAARLAERPGIIEHGLFVGMARRVLSAGSGSVQLIQRTDPVLASTWEDLPQ